MKQTPMQKEKYIRWYRQRRDIVHGSLGFLSFALIVYLLTSLERDPVLRRPRLILFDPESRLENARLFFNWIVATQDNVLPLTDPLYGKVARAVRKLTSSNKELLEDTDWTITIIYRMFNIASLPNVLILADRSIIIIYDMFNFIKSNDQLMFILAHEMAHEMLLHNIETLSVGRICDFIIPTLSFVIWVLYPRRAAAMLSSIMYIFMGAGFAWYKRRKEIEADDVGLQFSAKSCIDPREILVFWEIMRTFEELSGWKNLQLRLFMHHPSMEKRQRRTYQQLPKAMKLREQSNCPPLTEQDPRDNLPYYRKDIEKHMHKVRKFWGRSFLG